MKKHLTSALAIALAFVCILLLPAEAAASGKAAVPVLVDATQTSVTLEYRQGYSYSIDGTTWQQNPTFTDLTPGTTYSFYQCPSGQTDLASSALKVSTQGQTANPNAPVAPAIAGATQYTITLRALEGYEYRCENGSWQSSPEFTDLDSGTAYTFYQRIRQTPTQAASAVSQGVTGQTLPFGMSTAFNHWLLSAYIDVYGKLNSSGRMQVSFTITSNGSIHYYYMENRSNGIYCWTEVYDRSSSTSMHYTTGILLKEHTASTPTDMHLEMYYNNSLIATYTPSAVIDRSTFTQDSVIPLADAEVGSLLSNLYNASVKLLCASVSYFSYRELLVPISGLGFFAFDDETVAQTDICDPATGLHRGAHVLRYNYSETCLSDGYTGYQCCSVCGEVISQGSPIQAAGTHSYTNSCDTECNACGYQRTVLHTWATTLTGDSDHHWTGCSICGEKRNITDHAGGSATCGKPANCTTCGLPYGDVLPCEETTPIINEKYLKDAATCQSVAVYFESCTACGKAGTKTFVYGDIDPNNHGGGVEYRNTIPETCSQDGYMGDRFCMGCGVSLGAGEAIPASHSFTNYISNRDATYDSDGTETARCDRCPATNTRTEEGSRIIVNGWFLVNGNWCYYDNGIKAVERWVRDSKGWCYLGSTGNMVYNKWVKDSIGWCYVDSSGYMVYNKWVKDSVGWCYVDGSGYMVYNKWVKDSKGWCYVGDSGYMVYNKWVKDSIGWCYVDGSGYMVYNKWVKDSIGWCYVDGSGYIVYNKWVKDSIGWCYVDGSGYMITDSWVQTGGMWYYCNAGGYMATGWLQYKGSWYWLDSSGAMATGWRQISRKWYYFYDSGIMASNLMISGGFIGSDGVWDPNGTPYDRIYSTPLYSDTRVSISLYKLEADRIYFKVTNKTAGEITIQADAIAINGNSTDRITMSSDIAPYSTGYASAKCSFGGIYSVGTISGQLRVISFAGAFSSYDALFDSILVDSSVSVQPPVINQPLVYSDEKVDIYYKETTASGMVFTVRNKTDIVISIQADSISTNGISTDRITMSDDVAPHSVGDVVAKCSTGITGNSVTKIGGVLRIIDFHYGFRSYDAIFSNKYV